MKKVYECLYNFAPLNICAEIAYVVARNTEELHKAIHPFTDYQIISVRQYHDED